MQIKQYIKKKIGEKSVVLKVYRSFLLLLLEYRAVLIGFRSGLWMQFVDVFKRNKQSFKQRVLEFKWVNESTDSIDSLRDFLEKNNIKYCEGGWSFYLPPQQVVSEMFSDILRSYPKSAGLKILKNISRQKLNSYVPKDQLERKKLPRVPAAYNILIGTLYDNIDAHNYLYVHDVAPRLYDTLQFVCKNCFITAFVVEHVDGTSPSEDQCSGVLSRIKELIKTNEIRLIVDNWELGKDFNPPHCNGNVIYSFKKEKTYYVDTQNFRIISTKKVVNGFLSNGAKNDLHWGREYKMKGNRYLYQSIPGLWVSGRRNSFGRWNKMSTLLKQNNISLQKRLVIDIGCNSGMMLGYALKDGAQWGLGWDKRNVVEKAKGLMSLLGFTRFDMFGADLERTYDFTKDIPMHLHMLLDSSVIFYLAVRRWIGFLDELGKFPWEYLVYEGNESENLSNVEKYLVDLRIKCNFNILSAIQFADGETHSRPILILRRQKKTGK